MTIDLRLQAAAADAVFGHPRRGTAEGTKLAEGAFVAMDPAGAVTTKRSAGAIMARARSPRGPCDPPTRFGLHPRLRSSMAFTGDRAHSPARCDPWLAAGKLLAQISRSGDSADGAVAVAQHRVGEAIGEVDAETVSGGGDRGPARKNLAVSCTDTVLSDSASAVCSVTGPRYLCE